MNEQQVWAHLDKKYSDSPEKATFLYEVFYNRTKLVSQETYNSVHNVLTTPICTGVVFGQLAKQIAEINKKEKQKREKKNRKNDLKQAGEFLDNLEGDFGKGYIEGVAFCASYIPKKMLMVSMLKESSLLERLVIAFSKAIDCSPFCKYTDLGGMKTYEWAKNDSDERYAKLVTEGKKDLVRLNKKIKGERKWNHLP